MTDQEAIYARLDAMGIAYARQSHAPANHIADCVEITRSMGATVCKNYFLNTKGRKHFCLCLARPNARFVTSDISRQAGTPRLMFGGEEDLLRLLHTRPGSVSPMGLVFDEGAQVRFLMDRGLLELPKLAFHPCDNTQTLAMTTADFLNRFLPGVSHDVTYVDFHDFAEEDGWN